MRPQGRAGSDTFVRFLGANSRWVSAAAVLVSVGSWPNPGDDEACTAPLANVRRTTDADPIPVIEDPETKRQLWKYSRPTVSLVSDRIPSCLYGFGGLTRLVCPTNSLMRR